MQRLLNLRIAAKLALAFAIVVLAAVGTSGLMLERMASVQQNQAWTRHTYQVLDAADRTLSAMVDQETGLRGYLLSADARFLEPFDHGREKFGTALQEVRKLTEDNPAQQARLSDLGRIAGDWTSQHAMKAIDLVKNPDTREQGRAMEISGAGKIAFDAFRAKVAEVKGVEHELLVKREADQDRSFSLSNTFAIGGGIAVAGIAILLALWLARVIATPVRQMTTVLQALAAGDVSVKADFGERADEIGEMAGTIEVFRQNSERVMAMEATEKMSAEERERRAQAVLDLVQRVGQVVERAVDGDFTGRVVTDIQDPGLAWPSSPRA